MTTIQATFPATRLPAPTTRTGSDKASNRLPAMQRPISLLRRILAKWTWEAERLDRQVPYY